MMLTEKECRDALDYLYAPLANTMVLEMSYNLLIDLIDEHFKLVEENKFLNKLNDKQACVIRESFFTKTPCPPIVLYKPRPYKFEDLKKGMWVWDNAYKVFLKIIKIIEYGNVRTLKVGDSHCKWHIEFKENRFFPITKALEDK